MVHRVLTFLSGLGLLLVAPHMALAQGMVDQTAQAGPFQIELVVGPMETMISPDRAATATSGEVMMGWAADIAPVPQAGAALPLEVDQSSDNSDMSGSDTSNSNMSMADMAAMGFDTSGMGSDMTSMAGMSSMGGAGDMSMMASGGSQAHHVEVHILDLPDLTIDANLTPSIGIVNQDTGNSITLSPLMKMYGVAEGISDFHYGNNVDLAPGTYTFTVIVGSNSATFSDVRVN